MDPEKKLEPAVLGARENDQVKAEDGRRKAHPMESCHFLSWATVSWVSPLLRLGSKQALELHDVYELPDHMTSAPLGAKFSTAFGKVRGKRRVLRALFLSFGGRWFKGLLFIPFHTGCQIFMPLALKALIRFMTSEQRYLQDPFLGIESGWALAGIVSACSLGTLIGMNSMFLNVCFFGVTCRTALMEALYRKVLRLSETSLQQSSLGQIMTLVSADLERVFMGCQMSLMLVTSPILLIACMVLLFLEVGIIPTLSGFSIAAIVLPLNVFVARMTGTRKRRMLELTDARCRFMTDILRGIRLVKLYSWEDSVVKHVQDLRNKETHENGICVQLMAFTQSTGYTLPALIPFCMFIAYALMGEELSVEKVFAILALMNIIRIPMQLLPRAANGVIQALVSLRRIETFLSIPDRCVGWEAVKGELENAADAAIDVRLQMASCSWGGEAESNAMQELVRTAPKKGKGKGAGAGGKGKGKGQEIGGGKAQGKTGKAATNEPEERKGGNATNKSSDADAGSTTLVLDNVSLDIPRGQKVAIVGQVASGKSSLLYSILGELEVKNGKIARSTPVVPYCSQSAWIQSATLKENILMGLPEDADMYQRSIEAAQLVPDLQILQNGDQTSIGENGINLSGGQKARAALARAFYSCLQRRSPLILLDDPLAAVDAFVAHALFDQGFLGLLKDQTILLTLNAHLDLLSSFDRVICLEKGRIVADGLLEDIMGAVPWIKEAVGSTRSSDQRKAPAEAPTVATASPQQQATPSTEKTEAKKAEEKKAARPLYEPEDRVTGRVQLHNYIEWARAAISGDRSRAGSGMGCCLLGLLVIVFCVCQGFRITLDIWCARWAQNNHDTNFAVAVYGSLAGGFIFSVFLRAACFLLIAMRSCRSLHRTVLEKVLMAPVNLFFDVTQSGRILNRFSGDLEKVDDQLPEKFFAFLNLITTVCAALAVCIASSPFVVCGMPFIGYGFVMIVGYYQKSARELKRLDAMSRSPVIQQFSESIKGLVTIRAYNAASDFTERYHDLVNSHAKAYFTFWIASRWLAMRVDFCACVLQSFVAAVSIAWKDNVDPVMVGIALVWGFQLSGLLQFCVRSFAEVENTMTGVERLVAYKHVPQEAEYVMEPRPAEGWPRGDIELRNVSARYRPNLPLVLKDVSLHIQEGERVGICGRTGSGKSTMFLVLFRMIEAEGGQILIDGRDTKTIGLRDLRQGISIIPQDPILFRMTVRQNLDPFNMYEDEQIWKCLDLVCMGSAIRALSGELSFLCAEGGTNFSLGQMQLLCIARALLRDPGIVMMDEATANVDAASDEIIQRTIRSHFAKATVLTIAHRLSTIADSTKIAVFEQGSLCEFGKPQELVERGGALADLFAEAGIEVPKEDKVIVAI